MRFFGRSRFDPGAEDFGDAPGLGDAAARFERRFGVKDFVDGADAAFVQVSSETLQKFSRTGFVLRMDF